MPARLLIVSAVRLYRDGLRAVLERDGALIVTGAVATGAEAVALLDAQRPQVVLLDAGPPDAVATIHALRARAPQVKVIALMLDDAEGEVLACAEAGISGYVSREGSLDDLRAAVEGAVRDELVCSPRVAALIVRRVAALAAERRAPVAEDPSLAALTRREGEVARLMERGLSNKEIASRLSIEVTTVKNHVHRVLEKLQVHRRGQAALRLRHQVDALP